MAKQTFLFNDWDGGEFGDVGAAGAPNNSFTGTNVMRYRSGAIGPRPGVKALAPSGLPTGEVWGLTAMRPVDTRGIVFGVGNKVWGFTASPLGAAEQIGANLAVTPTTRQQFMRDGDSLIRLAVDGDKLYTVNPGADDVAALTGSPAARTISRYGVRLIAARTAANTRRVYYSAADNFDSWPALNFFDVPVWAVAYLNEIRQRLVISNQGGEWYALTGVPGVNDTLRRGQRGDLTPATHGVATRSGEAIWYLADSQTFPVQFTGTTVDKLRHRHLATRLAGAGPWSAASMPAADSVLFTESAAGLGLLYHDGVWTAHDFAVTPDFATGTQLGEATDAVAGPYILSDGGGVASAPQFWSFAPELDRPGKAGDTWAQPGDASTTTLTAEFATPEKWAERGEDLVARTLIVDLVKWNTGSATPNRATFSVRALHRYNTGGYKDSNEYEFEEAASETTEDATVHRCVFRMGEQGASQGFQIRGTLRGCAVKNMTLIADTEDRR